MFLKYLKEYKTYNRISVNTFYPEKVLNALQLNDILIWDSCYDDNILYFSSLNKDLNTVQNISAKYGCNISLQKQSGFIVKSTQLKKQRLLILLLCFCICVTLYLSTFIWNIEVNSQDYESEVTDFLYSQNIKQSVKKNAIDEDKLALSILKKFDEFSSVVIHIKGTTLNVNIQLRENPLYSYSKTEPVNLIAAESGIIDSIEVYNGTALVKRGDYVNKGDVLISGEITQNLYATNELITEKVHAMGKVTTYKEENIENIILDLYKVDVNTSYESEYVLYIGNKTFSYSEIDNKDEKISFCEKNKKLKIAWFEIPVLYDEIKWYNISNCTQKTHYEIAQEIEDIIYNLYSEKNTVLDFTYSVNTNSENKIEADVLVKYSCDIGVEEKIEQ